MASLARPTMLRQALAKPAFRINNLRAFQTSAKRPAFIAPGPQVIKGGVNDPAPVPEPNSAHGSYHWAFERLLAASMVPLCIAPFAAGSVNPTMDAIISSSILLHCHLGFQQVIIDYIPKRTHAGLHKLFFWLLRAGTLVAGLGLYEFETNDVGVTELVKRIWRA